MVYVTSITGNPLMPCNPAKARKLLRDGKAKIVKYTPFTIQLLFECENQVQDITLGVDAGSKYIGLSATTKDKELFSSEVELRNDVSSKLATRRQNRKTRRNRLRYRPARFNNRAGSKNKGWLAPSIEHKIQTHITAIDNVRKILPISKIIVETASFDIQKINNPNIQGKEYQEGEQLGFSNVRQYVLFRDNYTCQHCKGKSKDKILHVHHIIFRSKSGSDRPENLITLCATCHKKLHEGKIELNIKPEQFKHEAFMGIMRKTLLQRLQNKYNNVFETYGYITKQVRIDNGLKKSHRIDARCISGNPLVEPCEYWYYQKKVRCNNRQIHKANFLKGGKKRNNQASYEVKGFRLFDKVEFEGNEYFIFGRRSSGYFDLRNLEGNKVNNGSMNYRKIKFLDYGKSLLIERRMSIPPLG